MFCRSRLVAKVVQTWSQLKHIEHERKQRALDQLTKVVPICERLRQAKQIKTAFTALKRLTLSESAFDLYRLNQLRRCW